MKRLFYVALIAIMYMFVTMNIHMVKVMHKNKHGVAVFKINSRNYRKSLRSKKEYAMSVEPILEKGQVYLPVKYLANCIGAEQRNDAQNKIILTYNDIVLKISNSDSICFHNKGLKNEKRINDNIKIVNDELLLPLKYINEIFNLSSEYNDESKEIVIREI